MFTRGGKGVKDTVGMNWRQKVKTAVNEGEEC